MTDTNPQQADRRNRYAAAIRETDGWVLDDRQHMIDAVIAVADAEQAEMRERHHAGLRRADEINNGLMQEVQRYAAGTEQPVLWSVYNRMHTRALNAEAEVKRLADGRAVVDRKVVEQVREIVRRLANHAVGFGDVLDESDRGPWGAMVGADIAALQAAVTAASAPVSPAPADRAALGAQLTEAVQYGPTWTLPRSLAEEITAAVLAELPEPTNQAAAYAAVAELVRSMADEHPTNAAWVQDCHHIADRIAEAAPASGPGGAADETRQPVPADRPAIRAAAFDEAAAKLAGLDPVKAALAGQHAWNVAAGIVRHMAVQERRMADGEQQPETQADDGPRCTCADAGPAFAPAGHYADCPQAEQPAVEHCIHDRTVHRTHHKQAPVTGCPWCTAATSTED